MEREFPPLPSEPLPASPDPDVARVLDYWKSKCQEAGGGLPASGSVNLMDLYEIAPNLLLADVEHNPGALPRYRWRFWGTALTDFFSVEMSGRYIDEAYTPSAARQIIAAYDWVLQHRDIHFWTRRGGLAQDNQEHLVYRRLICPLTDMSGDVSRLFGIITFDTAPSARRNLPRAGPGLNSIYPEDVTVFRVLAVCAGAENRRLEGAYCFSGTDWGLRLEN